MTLFQFETVKITRGQKLGLFLRSFHNTVLVSALDPLSGARDKLQELDRIIEVDGYAMADKLIATNFIIQAIRGNGLFTCTLERPFTEDARRLRTQQIHTEAQPPSIRLAPDVLEIAKEERERMAKQAADDNVSPHSS